jgi:hypothetical protein
MIRNFGIALSLVLLIGVSVPATAQKAKNIAEPGKSSAQTHLLELIKSGQIEMIRMILPTQGGQKIKNFKMVDDNVLLLIDGEDSYYIKLESVVIYRVTGKVLFIYTLNYN